jgi:beta-galactosidase/beta-glucuronidase
VQSSEPAEVHPRPQMRRRIWRTLSGEWDFAFDQDDQGVSGRWFNRTDVFNRTIIVPYPPESIMSGIHEPGFHPIVWYRHEFEIDEELRADASSFTLARSITKLRSG